MAARQRTTGRTGCAAHDIRSVALHVYVVYVTSSSSHVQCCSSCVSSAGFITYAVLLVCLCRARLVRFPDTHTLIIRNLPSHTGWKEQPPHQLAHRTSLPCFRRLRRSVLRTRTRRRAPRVARSPFCLCWWALCWPCLARRSTWYRRPHKSAAGVPSSGPGLTWPRSARVSIIGCI